MSEEIRGCLTEVESCFQLLVPFDLGPSVRAAAPALAPNDLGDEEQPCCSKTLPDCARRPVAVGGEGAPVEDEEEDSDQEEFVRRHGLGSHKYTLNVQLCLGARPPLGACACSCWSGPPQAAPHPGLLGHRSSHTSVGSDSLEL